MLTNFRYLIFDADNNRFAGGSLGQSIHTFSDKVGAVPDGRKLSKGVVMCGVVRNGLWLSS